MTHNPGKMNLRREGEGGGGRGGTGYINISKRTTPFTSDGCIAW